MLFKINLSNHTKNFENCEEKKIEVSGLPTILYMHVKSNLLCESNPAFSH